MWLVGRRRGRENDVFQGQGRVGAGQASEAEALPDHPDGMQAAGGRQQAGGSQDVVRARVGTT